MGFRRRTAKGYFDPSRWDCSSRSDRVVGCCVSVFSMGESAMELTLRPDTHTPWWKGTVQVLWTYLLASSVLVVIGLVSELISLVNIRFRDVLLGISEDQFLIFL